MLGLPILADSGLAEQMFGVGRGLRSCVHAAWTKWPHVAPSYRGIMFYLAQICRSLQYFEFLIPCGILWRFVEF